MLVPAPLFAAGAGAITPGAVEQTLHPPPASPKTKAPPQTEVSPQTRPKAPEQAGDRKVKVEHFLITGNTVYTEAELNMVVADLVGTEMSLTDIYDAADRLTDYYQSRGYSLCTVTVPAQKMRDGILRLEVVEGRVGKLDFSGYQRYSDEVLQNHFKPLQPKTILKLADLERELLLMNDMPGLLVRSAIVPGEEYGTSDIQLKVKETPFAANAVLDNQGRKVIGTWRLGADFTINNPGKFGDVLSLGYTHSESSLLRQGRVSYGIPILHDGMRLNISYSRAEYDVGGDFEALGINGLSETARLQLSKPIIRTRNKNLAWNASLAHIQGQSDMLAVPLSNDEVNFLETGLDFNRRNDSGGMCNLSALLATNFRRNTDNNGSDLPPNLKLSGSHEHLLGSGWSAALRGEALFTAEALPDSNKYGLGGPTNVRGFVSSSLRGDQGGLLSMELRRYLQFDSTNILLRSFVDAGEVRIYSPSQSASLVSAGAGASVYLLDKYNLDLTWAKPIDGKDSGDGHSARLWMTFTASY